MRHLSSKARTYLLSCYVLGMLALGWLIINFWDQPIRTEEWLLGGGLVLVAAVCQVFVVARRSTVGQRSDHLTLAPLFAAFLLVPRPVLGLVIIVTFLPEWYVHRRPWFGQLFNISTFSIATTLSQICLMWLTNFMQVESSTTFLSAAVLPVLLVIPVFIGTQALLLAWVLKLARGQSFRQSGLFAPRSLLLELGLVFLGLGFATSWLLHPLYGLAAGLPLALIFDALHVPNLKEEAATDAKTGLANMRHFNEALARDLERATRNNQALSILMCDLDYLRNINNTYGHQAGDAVLCAIADIIRRNIRGSDLGARFGGEEFVVLLADTDSTGAQHVAERVRSELAQTQFDVGGRSGPISATISIGVASFPYDGRSTEVLLREADLAVYQSKREGRNRVSVAGRASRGLAGEWAREHFMPMPLANAMSHDDVKRPIWKFVDHLTRASINNEVRSAAPTTRVPAANNHDNSFRRTRDRRNPSPPPHMLLLIGCILAAGLLGLLPALHLPIAAVPWWPLALFAGLTVIMEQLAIDTSGRGKVSVATTIILAAAFLYGELGIAVTAMTAAGVVGIKARSPLHRLLFNMGAFLLAGEAAHWLFQYFAHTPIPGQALTTMLPTAVLAGLTFYGVNILLLCLVRALAEQCSLWQLWHREYWWLWPHYAIMGALGLVVALGYLSWGVTGILALMAPVAMMHVALKQYMDRTKVHVDELQHLNSRLSDSYEATLQALSRALDTRDEETEAHSQRVRRYTELIAQQLKVSDDELAHISRGALLHDIGKIGVPDAILLKPGKLTPDETALMRKHPEIGYTMIAHIPFLAKAAQVVLHHHEHYNGTGYPSGLSSTNIPLGARIFAVADTLDAMSSDRPYRAAMSLEQARAEIARCRGTQFDPEVVDAFLTIPSSELANIRDGTHIATISPSAARMITDIHLTLAET